MPSQRLARRPQGIESSELLDLVGLGDRARDKVQNYSLGMKQRLGIAAALLSDPQLLLARRAGERP